METALGESVALIDRYVMANSDMDAHGIAEFKKRQGGVGQSEASLCTVDALLLYDAVRSRGATAIREDARKIVARPGRPEWGDCL